MDFAVLPKHLNIEPFASWEINENKSGKSRTVIFISLWPYNFIQNLIGRKLKDYAENLKKLEFVPILAFLTLWLQTSFPKNSGCDTFLKLCSYNILQLCLRGLVETKILFFFRKMRKKRMDNEKNQWLFLIITRSQKQIRGLILRILVFIFDDISCFRCFCKYIWVNTFRSRSLDVQHRNSYKPKLHNPLYCSSYFSVTLAYKMILLIVYGNDIHVPFYT